MANTKELLGAMLRCGMTDSSAQRIEHSLSERGVGAPGGILEQGWGYRRQRNQLPRKVRLMHRAARWECSEVWATLLNPF